MADFSTLDAHLISCRTSHLTYLLPIGSLYDFAPAAKAVIWFPIQIPNTGWGRSLSSTFPSKNKTINMMLIQFFWSWNLSRFEPDFAVLLLSTCHFGCRIFRMFQVKAEASPTFWRLLMSAVARDGSPGPLEINRPSYSILIKSWFQGTRWTSAPLCKHKHTHTQRETHTDRHVIKRVLGK